MHSQSTLKGLAAGTGARTRTRQARYDLIQRREVSTSLARFRIWMVASIVEGRVNFSRNCADEGEGVDRQKGGAIVT